MHISDEAFNRALLFSSAFYYEVFDSQFARPMLSPLKDFLPKYSLLFSLFDMPENYSTTKELLFTNTNLENIAERIIFKNISCYTKYQLDEGLTAFVFTQKFESEDLIYDPRQFFSVSEGSAVLDKLRRKLGSPEISYLSLAWIDGKESAHISQSSLDVFQKASLNSRAVYIRPDLGQMFRSSWEANVARVFKHYNYSWEYEPDRFKIEGENSLFYWPDFLVNGNTVVEVKGFWDSDSLKKVSEFHKRFPEYKLIIVDSDVYYDIDTFYGEIIECWEKSSKEKRVEKIPIVGLKYVEDQSVFNELKIGDSVALIQEKDNPYDPNAILAVSESGKRIGRIAAEWAFIYSLKMNKGYTFKASVIQMGSNKIVIGVQRSNYENNLASLLADIS